jgi:hypothetical protein
MPHERRVVEVDLIARGHVKRDRRDELRGERGKRRAREKVEA